MHYDNLRMGTAARWIEGTIFKGRIALTSRSGALTSRSITGDVVLSACVILLPLVFTLTSVKRTLTLPTPLTPLHTVSAPTERFKAKPFTERFDAAQAPIAPRATTSPTSTPDPAMGTAPAPDTPKAHIREAHIDVARATSIEANICTAHHGWKVVTGRSWHCRYR